MFTLYSLCTQQLSKQPHYDFGLRNISGVMRAAGALKQAAPELTEDIVLFRTLRDMNMPKYIKTDAALFMALMQDIFQGVEPAPIDYGTLGEMIRLDLIEHGYIPTPHIIKKTIELFEAKNSRHCNMLVGDTGGGKTVALNTLCRVKNAMHKKGIADFNPVKQFILNPKAFSDPELYGFADVETREWTDGVLSVVMRTICQDEKPDEKWMVLDGPVDTLWIESMNTVMDDNKMLTLMSGERIGLPTMVTLVFEVQDLLVASPATVSRAGMLYFDTLDMGWQPNFDAWLVKKRAAGPQGEILADMVIKLFEKFVNPLLIFKMRNCHDVVYVADQQQVISLMRLLDIMLTPENGVEPGTEDYGRVVETWFVYCLVWTIGATIDETSRHKMDLAIREIDATIPTKGTVYDYYMSPEKKAWRMWEEKLSAQWRPAPGEAFFKILVPTVDTLRNQYIVHELTKARVHTLLVGGVGNGKTVCAEAVLKNFDIDRTAKLVMNFSAQTSSPGCQNIIEGKLDKRTKDTFGPPAGRNMITMVDDMNMPQKDKFGSHPPLELLRCFIQHGLWYDRQKNIVKKIQDMQLLALMGPAGGGRTEISLRMQSQFHIVNITTAGVADLNKIFGTLISNFLITFDEDEVKTLGDSLTGMLIRIFHTIGAELLPTPTKPVYLFNMRDLSKVVQGVLQANKDYFDTKDSVLKLFVHECICVFGDRLNSLEDRSWFQNLIDGELQHTCEVKWTALFRNNGVMTNFGRFMSEADPAPYQEMDDPQAVKEKLEETLDEYNLDGGVPMDLVLFKDAADHVCKIFRVLQQQRGNMLLVGIGGSGRQSLTRLASFLAEMKVFTIEINKYYNIDAFHEDLKSLYMKTGVDGIATVFFFNDTQIVEESFLEDVNRMPSKLFTLPCLKRQKSCCRSSSAKIM
jgi:dynein heavy chain